MKIVDESISKDYILVERKRVQKKSQLIIVSHTEPNNLVGLVISGELKDKLVLFVNCGTVKINLTGKDTFLVPVRDVLAVVEAETDEEIVDFNTTKPPADEWYGT